MKTINEVVGEMNRTELEAIVRTHYQMVQFDLIHSICEKQRNPDYLVAGYYINRNILMDKDLFDPRYDELLQKAVKGELDLVKLASEVSK